MNMGPFGEMGDEGMRGGRAPMTRKQVARARRRAQRRDIARQRRADKLNEDRIRRAQATSRTPQDETSTLDQALDLLSPTSEAPARPIDVEKRETIDWDKFFHPEAGQ
jgi:hypothetical protein